MTRILTAQFSVELEGPGGTGPFDFDGEVTGAVELRGDTYDIRLQSIRIGIETYSPAMVSGRVAEAAEQALVWSYEAAERRRAKQVDDIVSAARAHMGVMT